MDYESGFDFDDGLPSGPMPGALGAEEIVHHESRRHKRGLPPAKMQVNLTSMIDVIFQLLIYFVVTATFSVGEGVITAKLPQGPGKASEEPKPPTRPLDILVTSAAGASYRISIRGAASQPTTFSELRGLLVQLQYDPERGLTAGAYEPDNPVIIKPDGEVRWQHVVNAFNAALGARYTNISFAQAQSEG